MRLSGRVTIAAPPRAVWEALSDPAVLARTLPGCDALEVTGPHTFTATLTAGLAGARATYRCALRLRDVVAYESCRLTAEAAGQPGTVQADALVRLEDDGGRTVVFYTADAMPGGVLAGIGQRTLAGIAERTAAEFLAAVDRELAPPRPAPEPPQPAAAPAPAALAPDAAAPVPSGDQQPRPRRPLELVLAALIGAVLAVAGFVAGRRRSA